MKTLPALPHEFTFAGLSFPKYVWTLPSGTLSKRLTASKTSCCGPYYHSPRPRQSWNTIGPGFYFESDGMPGLRRQFADEIISLRHRGWYCDEIQNETIRGVVFTLPKSRGFLAGYTMGKGMTSGLDLDIYETAEEAARAADGLAQSVAEQEREYQELERAKERQEEETRLAEMADEVA